MGKTRKGFKFSSPDRQIKCSTVFSTCTQRMIKKEKSCILWYFSIIRLKRLCPNWLFNHRSSVCLCWWNKLKVLCCALVRAHSQMQMHTQEQCPFHIWTVKVCTLVMHILSMQNCTCMHKDISNIHSLLKDGVNALTPFTKCNFPKMYYALLTWNIQFEENMFLPQAKAEVLNLAHHRAWEMWLLQTQQAVFMLYTMCSCVMCKIWHNVSGIWKVIGPKWLHNIGAGLSLHHLKVSLKGSLLLSCRVMLHKHQHIS